MSFVLRIFFSGLIAFAPSPDGKELTVLLLDARHDFTLSDGTPLDHHKPLLLARAAKCEGHCGANDSEIARYLFPGVSAEKAGDSLHLALLEGGAWQLSGSQLALRPSGACAQASPSPPVLRQTLQRSEDGQPFIPTTSGEREDFRWVADFGKLEPAAGGLNPDLLSPSPPPGLITARLRLPYGTVSTYRLVRIENNVEPIRFQPLQEGGRETSYQQALASWVAAEIQVQGDAVEIVEESFGGERRRTMKLSPGSQEPLEIAILNLPPLDPGRSTAASTTQSVPEPGKHFELYYELAKSPPPKSMRLVPQAVARSLVRSQPAASWDSLHPSQELKSDLLDKIQLGIEPGRGPYDLVICPMVRMSGG